MWLGVGVEGCTLDVAEARDGPWMWLGLKMPGCGMRVKPLKLVRMIGQ